MAPLYPSFTPTYHHEPYPYIDPTTNPALSCAGQLVLITGAGTGIGQAIALAFAQAGAAGLILLGRTTTTLTETEALIRRAAGSTFAGKVFTTTADITDPSAVEAAFTAIRTAFPEKHGRSGVPDVLVQNAGGMLTTGLLEEADIEGFWRTMELNAKGPLVVARAFLRAHTAARAELEQEQEQAPRQVTIINIASGGAHLPYMPTGAAYCISKLANTKLTEYLHYETASRPGWRVFNLQPGVVATELARRAGRTAPDDPALAAHTAVWLTAHPEAERFRGCFLWANWDLEELVAMAKEGAIGEKGRLRLGLIGWAEGMPAEELITRARSVQRKVVEKE